MTATVVAPTTTAVEMIVKALEKGSQPEPPTLVELKSYPSLEELALKAKKEV